MSTTVDVADTRDVNAGMWRALAVLRFVILAHAVVVNTTQWQEGYAHPTVGWLVVSGLAIWTLTATWAYDTPRGRRWPVLCLDVAVIVLAHLAVPYVVTEQLRDNSGTLAAYLVAPPVMAWALAVGWVGGFLAAVVIAIPDLAIRTNITEQDWSHMVLLALAGAVVGYLAQLVREAAADRARAAELAAQTAERERLARAVHDGVLQVLAYVQRKGTELGGEAAQLARAAGEQESILRALVQGKTPDPAGAGSKHGDQADQADQVDQVDLNELLRPVAASGVSVATPAGPFLVDAHAGRELVAAARAALDNVARHAPEAKVYVLLEDEGDTIALSVRDDGPGIPDGRLQQAEAAGRMGVSRSIVARLTDLGGEAILTTTSGQGTEWELRIPVDRSARLAHPS